MKGFIAFTKKEFIEQIRTYRLLIMISVFFLIGMMSPLLAKLLPQIMSDVKVQGITLTIPEPTFIDAYSQFFKNMTQMGMIIFLLIFGGIISNELTRGTLVNILAKGLPRVTVILAKYTAALSLWTVSFCLSALTNYGYTIYFFEDSSQNLIFSLFCVWLFGAFVLALIFLSSTLVDGNFGGLILTAVVLVCMLVINSFPNTEKFNPVYLVSKNMALIAGTQSPDDFAKPLLITAALIIGCLYASVLLFRKKRL